MQRALATVVIFGIVGATGLMLAVFPGILRLAFATKPVVESDELPATEPSPQH